MKLRFAPLILASLILPGCTSLSNGGNTGTLNAPGAMPVAPAYLLSGETRTFDITYVGHIPQVPEGTKTLRVWLPVPHNSALQTIKNLKVSGPVECSLHTESVFGNRMAYCEVTLPQSSVDFTTTFTCTRKEHKTDLDGLRAQPETGAAPSALLLAPNRLVTVFPEIQSRTGQATAGKTLVLDRARGIYDNVMEHMSYDKSGQGWGQGDTAYACEVGKGNCTDFHALFMSMCRASGIAAGFEIGLYLPYEKGVEEKLGGYHCWAMFELPGRTWIPVDISEADRHAVRADYFFGNHTANRVTLSTGRDIMLAPAQHGAPLNYFLSPYAEADGQSISTSKDWSFVER